VTSEALTDFEEETRNKQEFKRVFASFLDDPANKLRPCFLRERE